jgi:hypothetical protein
MAPDADETFGSTRMSAQSPPRPENPSARIRTIDFSRLISVDPMLQSYETDSRDELHLDGLKWVRLGYIDILALRQRSPSRKLVNVRLRSTRLRTVYLAILS